MTSTPTNTDALQTGLPQGFRIVLDADTVQVDNGTLRGGSPARVMRLSAAGRRAWGELRTGPVRSAGGAALARRLTDAGLAHPRPPALHGRTIRSGLRSPALPSRAELALVGNRAAVRDERVNECSVTVVVPVRDRAAMLRQCLAGLGVVHPVVVVDDGSRDPDALADIAAAHSATLVRRPHCGGPAAARNSGLAVVRSELVAFVDSDCIAPAGWIEELVPHFADPLVAAVAPRILALESSTSAGRYGEVAGSLDMGAREGRVVPGSRLAYLPSAALLVRRDALRDIGLFDEGLRYGEDVDLIWRLHAAGLRVRYDPSVQVYHREPQHWPELLTRRFRYGTSAAPLAQRHPNALAPLVVQPWHAATALAALTGRPVPTATAFGLSVLATRRTLRRVGLPTTGAVGTAGNGLHQTWLGLGRFMIQFAGAGVAGLLISGAGTRQRRRFRRAVATSLLLGTPLATYFRQRPRLDPIRFVLGQLADHAAYGAGVWAGCLRHRTIVPITPVLARRPRRTGGAAPRSTASPSSSEGSK